MSQARVSDRVPTDTDHEPRIQEKWLMGKCSHKERWGSWRSKMGKKMPTSPDPLESLRAWIIPPSFSCLEAKDLGAGYLPTVPFAIDHRAREIQNSQSPHWLVSGNSQKVAGQALAAKPAEAGAWALRAGKKAWKDLGRVYLVSIIGIVKVPPLHGVRLKWYKACKH